MRKSKFTESEIVATLKQVERQRNTPGAQHSEATYYAWKSEYGRMKASDVHRLRYLGAE